MVKKAPVSLYKKEPLELKYNNATVYSTGTLFILILFLLAFKIGSSNYYFLMNFI